MTAPTFSTLGALIGLVLAIILIVKKVVIFINKNS